VAITRYVADSRERRHVWKAWYIAARFARARTFSEPLVLMLYTVSLKYLPPYVVVPYRVPFSSSKPTYGITPSVPALNSHSTRPLPVGLVLYTVPPPVEPPMEVVP